MPRFWWSRRGSSLDGGDASGDSLLVGSASPAHEARPVAQMGHSAAVDVSRAASVANGASDRSSADAVPASDRSPLLPRNPSATVIDLDSPRTSPPAPKSPRSHSSHASPRSVERGNSLPSCLICLETMDLSNRREVQELGCQCKGAAAYRHQECLNHWLTVKGDTVCDVCNAAMTLVSMPPPPPIPGYVVFPDLDHEFDVQWAAFGRYLWANAVAAFVYCLILALLMNVPIYVALFIAAFVMFLVVVRYAVSVSVNAIFQRPVMTFQTPEMS